MSLASPRRDELDPPLRFLAGGRGAARLILARDWTDHPLGPPADWSSALKTALSLILNSPESMILAWGKDDLHFFFNETYFPLLGPRLPGAMGAPFREVWADAWEQAQPIIADAFEGRARRFDDLPWRLGGDRTSAETWFTFSYSRVLGVDGDIAGLFVFTNETTGRVLADAALKETNERLRLVIEGARDHAIFTTDPGGVITSWSPGACLIFGWTAEEAIGRPAAIIFTPEDRAAGVDVQEFATAARTGHANDERWHLTKSGARVFMNGSVHPLPADAEGRPRGFIKVARDETERRRDREALEALNATLERRVEERTAERDRMWNTSPDLMVEATLDGIYQRANPAWRAILGYDPAEVVGRDATFFTHPDDMRTMATALETAQSGLLPGLDLRFRRKGGGYRWIQWVAAPTQTQIFAVGRDVTDAVEARAQLQQTEEQLRQAQKMEAVGQLTGGIAHDFNNMLTGVIGSLDLLKRQLAAGRLDRADRYIDAATTSAQRAAGLTHRLLAFSRRQSLDVRAVDVNALVASMEELLRRTLGEGVGLEVSLHADAWPAMTDGNQLESALLNLAINARDAMPRGGRLTVETSNTRLDAAYAAGIEELEPGDFVVVCVSDTGEGMTEEVRAHAFEPFFTTKPIGAGTGLGLSMIYGFARQSGGHARLYSEPGRGTTVKLYLPRHRGQLPHDPIAAGLAAPPAEAGEQVLLVEDDPAVRMLVGDVLKDLGYGVEEAADADEATAQLARMDRLDLLVTDVGLPGMNGRQLADVARRDRPDLKVLFMTGYAERAAVRGEFLAPGMDMITKPFAIDALAGMIRRMLEQP